MAELKGAVSPGRQWLMWLVRGPPPSLPNHSRIQMSKNSPIKPDSPESSPNRSSEKTLPKVFRQNCLQTHRVLSYNVL